MTFGLYPNEAAAKLETARANPLDPADAGPGFFDEVATSPLTGLARGLIAKPALLAGEALTPGLQTVAREIDERIGSDLAGWLDDERRKNREFLREVTPDPRTVGVAGQVVHALFDIGSSAIAFGPTGTGALEGTARMTQLREEGVDVNTAAGVGLIEGVATGVGVKLPLSIGLKRVPDLAYSAAASAIPNASARLLTSEVLDANGYPEMAAQYRWNDAQAIATDVVLGIALGGLGRFLDARQADAMERSVTTDQVDAALAANAGRHLEIDSAGGIPVSPEAATTHVRLMEQALDDLIAGRAVTAADSAGAVRTVANPLQARIDSEVAGVIDAHVADLRAAFAEDAPARAEAGQRSLELEPDGGMEPAAALARHEAIVEAVAGTGIEGPRVDPDVARARRIAAERPDLGVVNEDGTITRAADLMAEADSTVELTRADARAFDALVACALGR